MAVAQKKTDPAFSLDEVMNQLREMGTDQNIKIYRKHGADGPVFGVSFANLKSVAKKIKKNHELASRLWATGNFDAMNLAGMLADPDAFDDAEADQWLGTVRCASTSFAFAAVLSKSQCARSRINAWTRSPDEYTRACGYDTLNCMLREGLMTDDEFLKETLERIEKEIHSSANRARHSMNGAVIGIGGHRPKLRAAAIAAAKRIGKVDVDHGETDCVTPDAAPYIDKMAKRAKSK